MGTGSVLFINNPTTTAHPYTTGTGSVRVQSRHVTRPPSASFPHNIHETLAPPPSSCIPWPIRHPEPDALVFQLHGMLSINK